MSSTGKTRINEVGKTLPSARPSGPPSTRSLDAIEWIQPVRVPRRKQRRLPQGCLILIVPLLLAACCLLGVYLAFPTRTDLLVLGIDRTPEGTALGRTDTIIIVSIKPLKPEVTLLSIPRDLWVNIPGVGENRINTAHFFAEANQPGSGPAAALETVNQNFGVNLHTYIRVRFDAFQRIVDAMGGVNIELVQETAGLPPGKHHLDGKQALAFVRDRKGTDDFFRMSHGQLMIQALVKQGLSPLTWLRIPVIAAAVTQSVDTNLPIWQWPRLGFALLRASQSGFNARTVQREMTTPYITSGGADVLLPNWDLIRPMVQELFGN